MNDTLSQNLNKEQLIQGVFALLIVCFFLVVVLLWLRILTSSEEPTIFFLKELQSAKDDKIQIARRHFREAEVIYNQGDTTAAIAKIRLSLAAIPTASAYLNLSYYLIASEQYRAAEAAAFDGVSFARSRHKLDSEAALLFMVGSAHLLQGKRSQAVQSLEVAEAILEKTNRNRDLLTLIKTRLKYLAP